MKVVFLLTSFFLQGIAYSAMPLEGWYAGLLIGPSQAFDLNFNLTNPFTRLRNPGELNYSTGINVGGQLGYRYDKFRSEIQYLFNKNNFDTVQMGNISINSTMDVNGASLVGHTNFSMAMFNTYYEFYKEEVEVRLVPYIGLGIGYGAVNNSLQLYYFQTQIYEKKATGYSPMGQAIAGLSYFFTDSSSVSLDYRYLTTPQHQSLNSTISIQSINLVLNFSFG